MKRFLITLLTLGVLLMTLAPAAAQTLPNSPWYAVVHQPQTDTLHWINAAGEQASIPRPILPDEAAYIDLRFSPNGRTMVIVSELDNGLQGIGIYDVESGVFVQTHMAQPDETINLGGENIFTANSQYFAVGFFSGDFADPAWRVILFEAETGDATAFIDQTHPDAMEVQLSAPAVQYLDGTSVHFQMVPQSVGASTTWPTYRWDAFAFNPGQPVISESSYTRANVQVQLLTGKVVMSYMDENFTAAPQDGQIPNANAIGQYIPASDESLETAHVDSTRYHLLTRWAKGGEWILFLSTDAMSNRYWNIIRADGTLADNGHMPLNPQFEAIFGTSDGYLLLNEDNELFFTNSFLPNLALQLTELDEDASVVYVTPIGVNFAATSLGGEDQATTPTPAPVIETETPAATAPVDCSLAPPQRVSIGDGARVVPAMAGLNLRQAPNDAIIVTLSGGDTFAVIGGALCDAGLYWWQVNANGQIGWLAEGSQNGYFIEPYVGPPPTIAPPPTPTDEPGFSLVICGEAPVPRLSIGASALVISHQTPRSSPNGALVDGRTFMSGTRVTVDAGAECNDGIWWWLVTGTARITGTENTATVQGWLAESTTSGQYRMGP